MNNGAANSQRRRCLSSVVFEVDKNIECFFLKEAHYKKKTARQQSSILTVVNSQGLVSYCTTSLSLSSGY